MGKRVTWLVVAAVTALALAAAVDALRGEEGPGRRQAKPPSLTTKTAGPSSFAQIPAGGSFSGVLYYSDDDCRLRALELPSLHETEAPAWSGCAFSLSPTGRAVQPAGAAWSPGGEVYAAGLGGVVELDSGRRVFRGRVPAWRPDGTLTYVRDGAVRAWPSGRVLLSRRDLEQAAARHPNAPEGHGFESIGVRQVGWLDPGRVVVLLRVDIRFAGAFDLTAVFQGRRLVATVAAFRSFDRLWTSPDGTYFALGGATLELYDRNGNARPLPPLTDPRAIAWSPDESWIAVATRASIYVFRAGTTEFRLRRLPTPAHDLAWRGTGGAPELGDTVSLRSWLELAGANGELYVSDAGCRIRTLLLPHVEWADPTGMRGPCRFTVGQDGALLSDPIALQPQGRYGAICRGGAIDVFDSSERLVASLDGCTPAWKPDGSLTYLRGGELFLSSRLGGERVLLSREDIANALGPQANLEEIAWIDNERFWAAVRTGPDAGLALFRGRQLRAQPVYASRVVEMLRVGPAAMVAARTESGVTFFDAGGEPISTVAGAHAATWSPRSGVAAVAGPRGILFLAPTSGEVLRLPVYAADLEWR